MVISNNRLAYEVNDLRKEHRHQEGYILDLQEQVKTLIQQQETANTAIMLQSKTVAALGKQLNHSTLLNAERQDLLQKVDLKVNPSIAQGLSAKMQANCFSLLNWLEMSPIYLWLKVLLCTELYEHMMWYMRNIEILSYDPSMHQ